MFKFASRAPLAAAFALSMLTPAVHAQNVPPMNGVLNLSAQASAKVPQDIVDITLFYEQQGSDPGALSTELNRRAAAALAQVRGNASVTAHTGQFSVSPSTDRDGKISAWRGRVEIVLESRDFDAAAKLAGQLNGSMQVGEVSYSLSPEATRTAEQKLTTQAIDAFRARADEATRAFGYGSYTIRNVNINDGGGVRPMPRMMAFAAAAPAMADAPLAVEAGTSDVTVNVNGSVQMK
jgi:predicted secreted protein